MTNKKFPEIDQDGVLVDIPRLHTRWLSLRGRLGIADWEIWLVQQQHKADQAHEAERIKGIWDTDERIVAKAVKAERERVLKGVKEMIKNNPIEDNIYMTIKDFLEKIEAMV